MRPEFSSNDLLVDYLVRQGRIKSERVEEAFRGVDRREFVPDEQPAYCDRPVPIKDVTVSAPHIVAEVTELLELEGNEKVLEIGSGSGYQAAILGKLTEKVVGIEVNKDLVEYSRQRVSDNVEIRAGNGFKNVKEDFDRILFSCAAKNFDEALEHIHEDGIVVGPVQEGGSQILKKWKKGEISEHGQVRYVKMLE